MPLSNLVKTTVNSESPLDASTGTKPESTVSDFLTVQSFTNFAAMTGTITAAWHALQMLKPSASSIWVPYILAFIWGVISFLISLDGLKNKSSNTYDHGTIAQAIFIAFINSLVLAGAVVGTNAAVS